MYISPVTSGIALKWGGYIWIHVPWLASMLANLCDPSSEENFLIWSSVIKKSLTDTIGWTKCLGFTGSGVLFMYLIDDGALLMRLSNVIYIFVSMYVFDDDD